MIMLDTTVLVYALGGEHEYQDPCRTVVDAVTERRLEATTTAQVIQEFAYVRARRRGRDDAVSNAHAFLDLLSPLEVIDEHHLRAGLRLWQRHANVGSFDAVLAAAAIAHGAALVSADRGFGAVEGLLHIFPTTAAVADLIG